jgi:septal ring factor EnvC (AmiA/AmiB activator)
MGKDKIIEALREENASLKESLSDIREELKDLNAGIATADILLKKTEQNTKDSRNMFLGWCIGTLIGTAISVTAQALVEQSKAPQPAKGGGKASFLGVSGLSF